MLTPAGPVGAMQHPGYQQASARRAATELEANLPEVLAPELERWRLEQEAEAKRHPHVR